MARATSLSYCPPWSSARPAKFPKTATLQGALTSLARRPRGGPPPPPPISRAYFSMPLSGGGDAPSRGCAIERARSTTVGMTDVLQPHFESTLTPVRLRGLCTTRHAEPAVRSRRPADSCRQGPSRSGEAPLRLARAVQFTTGGRCVYMTAIGMDPLNARLSELLLAWVLTVRSPTPIDRHPRSRPIGFCRQFPRLGTQGVNDGLLMRDVSSTSTVKCTLNRLLASFTHPVASALLFAASRA